jgi:hypothetical protein
MDIAAVQPAWRLPTFASSASFQTVDIRLNGASARGGIFGFGTERRFGSQSLFMS